MTKGFDNEKYISLQSEQIQKRISQFGGKLYLEFGGKLFDDFHASRVLPGFEPDSKIRMLQNIASDVEMMIVISADDIDKFYRKICDSSAIDKTDASQCARLKKSLEYLWGLK